MSGLSILNLDAVRAAPVSRAPYTYFLGNDVLNRGAIDEIRQDFPAIAKPGISRYDLPRQSCPHHQETEPCK